MPYTPELRDEIVASRLQILREAAADHPAHAERLETLIRHYSASPTYRPEDAPLDAAQGLSARVANMLDDDVSNVFWWRERPDERQFQPLQYPAYILNLRKLAADRQRRAEAAKNEKNSLFGDLHEPTEEK